MTQGALLSIALCSVMHSSAYTCAHAQFDVTCLLICTVAGFCLKTRTDAEEKVFINVCTSDLVRIGKHVVCLSVCMCLCVVHVCLCLVHVCLCVVQCVCVLCVCVCVLCNVFVCCACVFVCCACVFVCCACVFVCCAMCLCVVRVCLCVVRVCLCVVQCVCVLCVYGLLQFTV